MEEELECGDALALVRSPRWKSRWLPAAILGLGKATVAGIDLKNIVIHYQRVGRYG